MQGQEFDNVIKKIYKLYAGGSTDIYQALKGAAARFEDVDTMKDPYEMENRIIIITDDKPTVGHTAEDGSFLIIFYKSSNY